MKRLNYSTLKEENYQGYLLADAPERILQFGEGNFLRAFVDYFVDHMNEKADFNSKIVVCQPIKKGMGEILNEQDGLYTVILRGTENGEVINKKRIVSSVSRVINPYDDYSSFLELVKNPELRFIVSNTTEAGIVFDESCKFSDAPPSSYPAKLTVFLYERYKLFGKKEGKGFIILPCELIDNNAAELYKCVLDYIELWGLGEDFLNWVNKENKFCPTLVDRIVTGYPKNEASNMCIELGYEDKMIDTAEVFGLWVIEADESVKKELPFEKAELPIIVTEDHGPYKRQKVRILNGAHTGFVLGAFMAGQNIVRDALEDDNINKFMNKLLYDEVIPNLDLPKEQLMGFAKSVSDRFKNPFIDHELISISLNSTSKWRARLLPSLKAYIKSNNDLPPCITMSFAFYINFYMGGHTLNDKGLVATRNGEDYIVSDDKEVLEFYYNNRDENIETLVEKICKNTNFWGEDLSEINGFVENLIVNLKKIQKNGVYSLFMIR